jgi:tRNA pseudouridine55 synthase
MRKKRDSRAVDGILLLDKPQGWTSNFALQRVKRIFRAERAGHTGTLDPMATGLLPICLGEATKFGSVLLESDKSYLATLKLGECTDTGDAEGKLISSRPVQVLRAGIQKALEAFRGDISQIPPMYSALKRDGRPLYELARQGRTIEREARPVTISKLELIEWNEEVLVLDVTCSKGTYVRVLAEDIGAMLGCGAHLTGLRRTAVAGFTVEQAHTLESLDSIDDPERLSFLLPVDAMLAPLGKLQLPDDLTARFEHGMTVQVPENAAAVPGKCRVYSSGERFMGVGILDAHGWLKPERLLRVPELPVHSAPEDPQST